MAEPRTNEETLALLQEVAATKGDNFRVKVMRKRPQETFPTIIGTFEDARVEHLADPQLWLPDYSGGGTYYLQMAHVSEPAKTLGGTLAFVVDGPASNINEAITNTPGWRGPRLIPRQHARQVPVGISGPDGGMGAPSRIGDTPGTPVGASSSHVAQAGVSPEALRYSMATQQLESQKEELRRREAQMQEERHRNDMETMRREQEAREAKLRAEMAAAARPAVEAPKGPGVMEIVTGLATALLPIAVKMMESSEKAAERIAVMQQENSREMRELMKTLAAPKPQDPLVASVLEANQKMLASRESASAQALEMIKPVMTTVGEVSNFMMAQFAALREMQGEPGEPPNPIVTLAGKVADVLAAGAAAKAAERPAVPQLPAAAQPRFAGAEAPAPAAAPAPAPAPAAAPAPTVFQNLVERIMRREDPKTLVPDFWNAVQANEPSVMAELQKAGGDPAMAFAPYLMQWLMAAPAHQEYARDLNDAVEDEGISRGLIEQEEEDAQEDVAATVAQG